ncbi:MAG: nitrous oxide reductase accessory protein NosL [Thiovulaceae bacterium]|nr:nitrous oxide reductase accessory protein NosL [Sulfurimonadaceae bacterium]
MKKILVGLLFALSLSFSQALTAEVVTADSGYSMNFTKETTGLVRHLKVYKSPRWVSKITLTNGKELFFSSPKSMLEFYYHPGKWFDIGVKSEDDFKDVLVTDYETMKPINAKGAFYVYGSSDTSPAGDDLVPFGSYDAAQRFAKQNNGTRVLAFTEISEALINLLNGKI